MIGRIHTFLHTIHFGAAYERRVQLGVAVSLAAAVLFQLKSTCGGLACLRTRRILLNANPDGASAVIQYESGKLAGKERVPNPQKDIINNLVAERLAQSKDVTSR